MKILFISTEAVPYYKTGGVADVVHGLARELCLEGHDARIAIPRYRALAGQPALKKLVPGLKVSLGDYERWGTVWKAHDEPAAYLIEQEFYFGRNDLYDYPDDYERFIFFTRGVLDMLASPEFQEAEAGWFPEVIQGYDWATGLVPSWLPEYARQDPRFTAARFVLFIYNIRRAGVFGSRALQIAGQKGQGIYPQVGETPEQISFLGRGALFADKIVTGSHISSSDSALPEMAQKMVTILESRKADWEVIPNAIDNQDYDPADSLRIPHPFTNETVGKERWKNKLALQDELKMKPGKDIPLLGMVSRLIPENGFDLFPRLIEKLKKQGESQLAVLAESGDAESMQILQDLERSSPSGAVQIKSRFSFDEGLARRIYAGCDIYLIPSLHMPSGIQQLIAMHFGAIPVVYATGALRHSIEHYQRSARPSRQHGRGTGFVFEEYTADVFADTVLQAIDLYRTNPGQWLSIQRYNMRLDFTWYESASQYLDLFQALQSHPTRVSPPQGTELHLNPDAHLLQAIIEIDNLPGLKYRESIRILKQAARLVRGVINCDAVYVWELGKGLELGSLDTDGSKFVVAEKSLANHRESEIDDHEAAQLLHQGVSNAWRQLADIDSNGICQPILGLEISPLAQKQGWVLGRSVPITAHGRALGRIDVLFTQKQIDELYRKQHKDATWLASALTALATSFGLRLETIRYANEADQISEIGRKLLSARSVKEAAQKVVELAKQLTNAEHAWLYLNRDGTLEALEQEEITDCGKPLAEAQLSLTEPEPRATYIPEWGSAPRDAQGHRLYRSLVVVPLADIRKDQALRVNGILEVAKFQPAAFNRDQEHMLLRHLGPQAAVVLETTLDNDRRGQEWVQQLTSLSESLVGGGGFQQLLEKVVDTTTEVLRADAASLYLTDEKNQKLLIQAASGYQAPLVAERASYAWGEGVTGKIAETKKPFLANLLSDLRERGGGPRGKYDDLQGGKQPESFYGLPLVVKGREQPIGVLKFESLKPEFFTDETVLLIQMMASVIATVVYNTQLSRDQLSEFSANLGRLSGALAASGGMEALMTSIVDTATEVLNADAASLYLADEKNQKLLIQAASGYQAPLKPAGASYLWGEGVTGRIAETGQPFLANSLPDLRQRGGGPRGKYDDLQGGLQPASFYGLPMIVKGRERPIGVLKVESLRTNFFTPEDVLLIDMMGNVIATVVYNAQIDQKQLLEFLEDLGSLADPRPDASRVIFTRLAQSSERGLNEPLAKALAVAIGDDSEKAYQEALKLLEVGAGNQVFASIADDALPGARRRFSLFASAMRNSNIEPHYLQRVFAYSHRWAALEESSGARQSFEAGVTAFMEEFCHACGAKINDSGWEGKWFGLSLDTSRTFKDTYLPDRLSFAFHRSGSPQNETDLEDLNNLLENRLNYVKKWVALPMWGDVSVVKRAEEMLLTKSQQTDAIEVINLDINKIQQMVGKSRPDIELQREVLTQVRLTSISPYLPRTPAGKRIFFGRENEIRQMVEGLQEKEGELSKSYSIIGGRRIGKTSILLQLHTVRLRSSNFYTVYKDCAPVSWANFLSSPIGLTDWQPKAPQDPPMTFGELLSSTAMDQLVLLLDEIDDLVAKDRENDWRLFKTMRSLAHSGRAHVILSGERTLREALHDSNGPLFNFTYPIRLGPLDRPNVDKLVTHPLKQLGIQFEQEETILETIFNFTSGHPQVVNSLCERLIGRITEKQTRCIRPEDVMDVIEDPGFIRDEFLETYFSKATVLEHLCALLMAQNQKLVTGSAVRQALSKLDVLASLNQVDAALERLVDLRNILVRKKVGYAFQVAAFPRIISVSEQMSDMIALRREIFNDLGDISPENAPLNYQGRLW